MSFKDVFLDRTGGIGRALSSRNFRVFWVGHTVSVIGSWVWRMALGWLTWELTASPGWLGTVTFAAAIPTMVFSPIGGYVADRFGYRRTVVTAQVLEILNMALISALAITGTMTIHVLVVLAAIHGTLLAFDFPVRQALVAVLVDLRIISSAIAMNTTTFYAGQFIGPLIGGLITANFDTGYAFLATLGAQVVFVTCLSMLRVARDDEPAGRGAGGFAKGVWDGLVYAVSHPGIRWLFFINLPISILVRPYTDLMPAFAAEVFGRGSEGLSLLLSASGLGALSIGVWLAVRGRTDGLGRVLAAAAFLAPAFVALFSSNAVFAIALPCLFLAGMAVVAIGVSAQSLMQNAVAPGMRGRVIGMSASVAVGGPALGSLALGAIGEVTGIQWPVGLASVAVMALALWSVPRLLRRAGELEAEQPQAAAREGRPA